MRQVTQNSGDGRLHFAEYPTPAVKPQQVLIANAFSLLSAGTEKTARKLARQSLLQKARQRPDHVIRVLERVRREGLRNTIRQVRDQLEQPVPMGYCSAGVVVACGEGVQNFKPGDRVASNGPHADLVGVPRRLCAKVPDSVGLDEAAFTILGAIALQGIRLSRAALGETALVIGLGLVGQITTALLRAAGVRVVGVDLDASKCELAKTMGADWAAANLRPNDVLSITGGLGADVVLITASTPSDQPVEFAAEAVRAKGRIVAVGAVGMNLPRLPLYFKEAEFVVSCSYGPGRYDPTYEEGGRDYPAAYVRWTEQRNMEAVLDLLGRNQISLRPLISHRFAADRAAQAYELLEQSEEPYLGVLLEYEEDSQRLAAIPPRAAAGSHPRILDPPDTVGVSCLGAGNFARATLLPKLGSLPFVRLETLCSAGGVSAATIGGKLSFRTAATDEECVYGDPNTDALVIATRHHQHAQQTLRGIESGKAVFVEKPLCMNLEELRQIERAIQSKPDSPLLMVGFNRRFSPAAQAVRRLVAEAQQPLTVSIRFNAGAVPANHWAQDDKLGGGRIVGEACHAIDLASFLTGAPVQRVFAESIGGPQSPAITDDQCFITLRHTNGAVSCVAYLAGGDQACPKERVELIGNGVVAVIDDFRSAIAWSGGKRRRLWKGPQDKGHAAELAAFIDAVRSGGAPPIAWEDLRNTTLTSILAVQSLREGFPLEIPAPSRSAALRAG